MKSEKTSTGSDKSHFAGCVELIPAQPMFIEFVTAQRLCAIPIRQLEFLVLSQNPEAQGKKTSPPDLLTLVFETRIFFLFGWRLEMVLDPLMQGRVKRVHAEKYLGTLMIGEPWISEIIVAPRRPTAPF